MLPEIGVIFDAGTGLYRVRDLIETDRLDIFLSHVHLDHSVGLTFLYDILYGKDVKVVVHVEESKIHVIRDHLYHPDLFPVEPNFEIVALTEEPWMLNDKISIESFELGNHPGGSRGFKMMLGDQSFAYVTDTLASADATYLKNISGVNTLLHECYFPDGWDDRAKLTGHSCLTPVVDLALKAQVEALYLVHINPLDPDASMVDLEKAQSMLPNTFVTEDEMVIDV